MHFRREEREHLRPVQNLHLAAFGDHGHVVAALVDELGEAVTASEGLSLIAEDAGEVVGT